jgi:hypothetical protein
MGPSYFQAGARLHENGDKGLAAQIRNMQAVDAARTVIAGGADATPAVDFSVADSSGVVGQTLITADATGGTIENQFTLVDAELGVPTGTAVVFRGSDLPAPVAAGTTYYIIRKKTSGVTNTSIFQVAESEHQARHNEPLVLTDDGTGTQWIERQIALPADPVTYDSLGGTTGVLDTQVKAVLDTHMETLASIVNVLAPIQVDLGMPVVDIGALTGAVDTVAAIDVTATANTNDDDAADYTEMVDRYAVINSAIKTVAYHVNDIAAAVGQDEYLDFLSPQQGEEAVDPTSAGIEAIVTATSAVGGAAATVELTEFNKALVVWGAAIGNILQRVSAVSAAAQSVDNWTNQLVPAATEVQPVLQGLYTRGRP